MSTVTVGRIVKSYVNRLIRVGMGCRGGRRSSPAEVVGTRHIFVFPVKPYELSTGTRQVSYQWVREGMETMAHVDIVEKVGRNLK